MNSVRRLGLLAGATCAVLVAAANPAWAVAPVQTNPANWTPQMVAPAGAGYVRQLVPCGGTMYAVGTFSQFKSPADGGQTFTRNNAMSFSGSTGKMTAFNPNTDGIVNSIALDPANCGTAWIGGKFTTVGGQPAKNIAAVDTATGALKPGFGRSTDGQVNALLYTHGRVLVGGYFSSVNGVARAKLASLNPTTGAPDSYLTLGLTGSYPGNTNPTRAYNFTLSNSGARMLVTGVFTAVGGVHREQVFQLDLGTSAATLNSWTSSDFYVHCADSLPFYLQDATYSPDDSRVYVATTGYKRPTDPLHTGICDAAAAYPSSGGQVSRLWVNYTGCDSLYSVAADASTVYVAGHQRYLNNELGCDSAGTGAVSRPGIGGVDAVTGRATAWNPTRSRGVGADDLVLAFGGLWVASDDQYSSTYCGNEYHPGICFLPY
jgi:hypothetical protein